jgi:AraC-like DNA-binding protein
MQQPIVAEDQADAVRSEQRSAVRIEARGTEPAAVVDEVGGLYDGKDWAARPTEQPFTYRYTALGDDQVTLRRSRITGWIRGAIPHTDDYVLQWITEGQAVPDTRRDRVPLAVGVPMLFPSAREFVFEYRDYDQRLVHLSRELVHEVAEERFHTLPTADLGLDHLRRLDPAAVARWRAQMGMLAGELRSGVGTLLWQNLTRSAASAFLDLYPPTVATMPDALLTPRRARIRAAVEFVHAHAAEPLTVSDIARAGDLSVRSVQEGFIRDLGTTPMTYLLQVRLCHVRDDLRAADPALTSVQDVARRWGFAHLGRFSAAYARAFGEYPRDTLRR